MKITYTGKQQQLTPAQQKKLDALTGKISKMLDRRGEREAHVALSAERHLQEAEVTLAYFDHSLVAFGSGPDQFTAIHSAFEKVEKQALKVRAKRRETKRETPEREARSASPAAAVAPARPAKGKKPAKVVRMAEKAVGKPKTVAEAMMEMEDSDYVVYRDADSDRVSVLVRRRDGRMDLIEA
jgi:putative sigma-54 modulation protein